MRIFYFVLIVWLFTISLPGVWANPSEYLNEFNYSGEVCNLADDFYYKGQNGILTEASLYKCCVQNTCTSIFFDTKNQKKFSLPDLEELFNLAYSRQLIKTGNVKENLLLLEGSLDVCEYLGLGIQDAIDLTAEVAENGKVLLPVAEERTAAKLLNTGKKIGLIGKVNPTGIIISIACDFSLNQEQKAFKQFADCQRILHNLNTGWVEFEQLKSLASCQDKALEQFRAIHDSMLTTLKEPFNRIVNAVEGIFTQKEPEKTSYENAKSAMTYLSSLPKMSDNNALLLAFKSKERINEKEKEATALYNLSKQKFEELRLENSWLSYILYEPNLEQTSFSLSAGKMSLMIDEMSKLSSTGKYNSALVIGDQTLIIEHESKAMLEEWKNVRKIDYGAILSLIGLLFLLFIFYNKKPKGQQNL